MGRKGLQRGAQAVASGAPSSGWQTAPLLGQARPPSAQVARHTPGERQTPVAAQAAPTAAQSSEQRPPNSAVVRQRGDPPSESTAQSPSHRQRLPSPPGPGRTQKPRSLPPPHTSGAAQSRQAAFGSELVAQRLEALGTQAPSRQHSPGLQRAQVGRWTHTPLSAHCWSERQTAQSQPPRPHLASSLAVWQRPRSSQQPVQVWGLQPVGVGPGDERQRPETQLWSPWHA